MRGVCTDEHPQPRMSSFSQCWKLFLSSVRTHTQAALYHLWETKPSSCTFQSCFWTSRSLPLYPSAGPVHPTSSCLPLSPVAPVPLCSSWDRACHRNVTGRHWWVSGLTDEGALLFPSTSLARTETPAVHGSTVHALKLQPYRYNSSSWRLQWLRTTEKNLLWYKRKYHAGLCLIPMLHCAVCVFCICAFACPPVASLSSSLSLSLSRASPLLNLLRCDPCCFTAWW